MIYFIRLVLAVSYDVSITLFYVDWCPKGEDGEGSEGILGTEGVPRGKEWEK
jgi:hypothetical protein